MGNQRKLGSTIYPMQFLIVLSVDHTTGATGLSPTVTINKNGSSFASPAGSVTEVGFGLYALAGNATDRNTLGEFWIHVSSTGTTDPVDKQYEIVSYDPFAQVDANVTFLAGQTVVAASSVTFPSSLASPTNITAGTMTTVGTVNVIADPGDNTGPTDIATLSKKLNFWLNEALYLTTQDANFRYLWNSTGTVVIAKMAVSQIAGTQSKGHLIAP